MSADHICDEILSLSMFHT